MPDEVAGAARSPVRRLGAIFESFPAGVVVQEADGRITAANPEACRILMLSLAEMQDRTSGDPRWCAVRPDGAPLPAEEHPASVALRTGQPVQDAVVGMRVPADGETRWLQVSAVPCREPDGPGFVFTSFRDVTGERRQEQVAAARARLLELATRSTLPQLLTATLDEAELLTSSCIGFFHFVEPDGQSLTLQAWSTRTTSRFCTAVGPGLHYAVERAGVWADCVRQRRPIIHNDYASLPERKGLPQGHARVVRELVIPILRDGRVCAVLGVGNKETNYNDGDTAVANLLGDLAWDICARRRSDEILAEREGLHHSLFNLAPSGVVLIDPTGRLVEFNDQACRQLGYTREEFARLGVGDIDPDESDPAVLVSHLERIAARGGEEFVARQRTRTGDLRWVLVNSRPVQVGGQPHLLAVWQDITERKRDTERLAAEHERLAVTLRSIGDAVISTDRDARVTMLNGVAETLTGWTAAEAQGRPLQEILRISSEATGEPAEDPVARVLRKGGVVGLASGTLLTSRDGTVRPIVDSGAPIRDASGSIRGVVLVFRDETEQRRAERALRAELDAKRQLAAVAVNVPGAVYVRRDRSDGTGCMTFTTPAIEDVLGVTSAALAEDVGPFESRIHPEDRLAFERHRLAALREHASLHQVFRYQHPTKGWRWLESWSVAHPAPEGEELRHGFVMDVTDRKGAEQELARSEERFRAIIERSSDLTLVLDADERITFVSPASRGLLGFEPAEMQGRFGREFVHPEDTERTRALFQGLLAKPSQTVQFEIRLRDARGVWKQFEAHARNMLEVPRIQGIVINHRDVTERNRLRDQFQQAQKLESVGRLAGGVAHDFNNLLTVILGSSEALLERTPPDAAEVREELEEIHAAGERARDLTGQLLAFARKQVIAPIALDLNAVARKHERMLGRLLGEDVDLRVDLQRALWLTLADPTQVEQVLLNLAVNARDAMPRGGTLTIETHNRPAGDHGFACDAVVDSREWVQLLVRDTGSGMTPAVQAHLFEPFFTTKDQGKGTGLGLATVYGVVAQAGGHIHVQSAPGAGSTFLVCLPRLQGEIARVPAQSATYSARGTERILVVEDDATVRGLLARTLEGAGYAVTAVGHPGQALELGDEELAREQLLVTDVIMPDVDGRTLAETLSRRAPGLRVLFLSGYTQDVISERGVIDSSLQFLAKPFTRLALLAKVRTVLDGAAGPDHRAP